MTPLQQWMHLKALEELQPRLDKNPRTCLIVAGDFNAPGIDWPQLAVKQEGPNKEMCNRLIDILATSQLKQLVEVPTRQKAILDLFCINKPGLIKNFLSFLASQTMMEPLILP